MKIFKVDHLFTIDEILPDIDCNKCRYRNEKFCKDKDCYNAMYDYFLNKDKENRTNETQI